MRYLLVQGDCRKVLSYIKTESIHEIVTSPPYYMMAKYGGVEGEIGTKGTREQYIKDLVEVFIQCYRVLKPTGLFMLNIDNAKREGGFIELSAYDWIPFLRKIGFNLVGTIAWHDRSRRTIYNEKILDHFYEPIFILAKTKDYTFHKFDVPEGDVWEIQGCYLTNSEADEERGDAWDKSGVATFPVELATYMIALGSNEGETILDPFMGSGTVMDVGQRLKRNSIGIEINMDYCERIMKRCFKGHNEYRFVTQGELERGQMKL